MQASSDVKTRKDDGITRRDFLKMLGMASISATAFALGISSGIPIAKAQKMANEIISYVSPKVDVDYAIESPFIKILKCGNYIIAIDYTGKEIKNGRSNSLHNVINAIMNMYKSGSIVFIFPGDYESKEPVFINNMVILANPFVTIDGEIVVGSNVYVYGWMKVRKVNLLRAKEYYLEVDEYG